MQLLYAQVSMCTIGWLAPHFLQVLPLHESKIAGLLLMYHCLANLSMTIVQRAITTEQRRLPSEFVRVSALLLPRFLYRAQMVAPESLCRCLNIACARLPMRWKTSKSLSGTSYEQINRTKAFEINQESTVDFPTLRTLGTA